MNFFSNNSLKVPEPSKFAEIIPSNIFIAGTYVVTSSTVNFGEVKLKRTGAVSSFSIEKSSKKSTP